MSVAYLPFALLAALSLYLASAHQRLWPGARAHAGGLRVAAALCALLALAAASRALGIWAGVFAASAAIMLAAVLLPYADAWRRTRREAKR
jgi:hypothetical protein